MHPDERNMAIALQNLSCSAPADIGEITSLKWLRQCFNPNFFAYGQFPLYLGYLIIYAKKILTSDKNSIIFSEAVIGLRLLSAFTSILTIVVLFRIFKIFNPKSSFRQQILAILLIIFSPILIQFSHFGTTESLLIFFITILLYISLFFIEKKITKKFFISATAFIIGLSLATKISSIIFLVIPIIAYLLSIKDIKSFSLRTIFIDGLFFFLLTLIIAIIFSPHNLINWHQFQSAIRYESDVALGKIDVFYTRQFAHQRFLLFPLLKIFPFALGIPVFILFFLGLILLKNSNNRIKFLRLVFFSLLLPNLFIYTQWTRFYAPLFPLMLVFALLFWQKIKKFVFLALITFLAIIPGLAFLNIYQNQDIRIEASEWIYQNLPNNAFILSETANVVDIPFLVENKENKRFNYLSFNFYDLDRNPSLLDELNKALSHADFIIIPSRRVLFNLTCLKNQHDLSYGKKRCQILQKDYPNLINYYRNEVFNNKKYRLVKIFTRYPKIFIGEKKILEFPDESAEETFSVFDHPVIRIYQKIK
jgi:hypothetical protein